MEVSGLGVFSKFKITFNKWVLGCLIMQMISKQNILYAKGEICPNSSYV